MTTHHFFAAPSSFPGFPCASAGKESACNAGDMGSIPGLGRSPGEGKGYPLQYSGLENSMDYIVQGLQSQTQVSDLHTHTQTHTHPPHTPSFPMNKMLILCGLTLAHPLDQSK